MTHAMRPTADAARDAAPPLRGSQPAPTGVVLPLGALAALRGAVLAAPDGQLRLRDAGFVAGGALYDAFAERARERAGYEPTELSLSDFVRELAAFFRAQGWGALDAVAGEEAETVALRAGDWAEADAEAERPAAYPACHFSTGVFAGFLARVAGQPLAVLEVHCRAAGDDRCEFLVGSPPVMDRIWEEMMRGGGRADGEA
jgi:predicted hydrocarbon binding protein